MATTLRELELLSPLPASQSTLPTSARPLHRAAVWGIFHLITGLFLIIYASHIPCHFHCVSHSTPTLVLSGFLFHFHHQLCSSVLRHPQPVQRYKNSSNFEHIIGTWHGGSDFELAPRRPRFNSSQQPTWNSVFPFFYNLVSIHFRFCFEYTSPSFTMLGLLMFSFAVGSNFRILHLCQPQQHLTCSTTLAREMHFYHLATCPIIQSCIHQISTQIHSTVSIAPSLMGGLTGISHTHSL